MYKYRTKLRLYFVFPKRIIIKIIRHAHQAMHWVIKKSARNLSYEKKVKKI